MWEEFRGGGGVVGSGAVGLGIYFLFFLFEVVCVVCILVLFGLFVYLG